jgi:hypothetical protein
MKINKIKTLAILAVSLLFSCTSAPQDNNLTAQEKSDGWQSLFNGNDMAMWRNFKQEKVNEKWIIEDGQMILTGKGGGDILTKEKYTNFELKLDWKVSENGNSGIFILADETGKKIYSHAPEIQILDNERHKDRQKPNHRSGSLYDMITSPAISHKVAGEWNQVKISFKDSHLKVWQNNILTAEVTIGSKKWKELLAASKFKNWKGFAEGKSGHIGLQDHGDRVSFKNLKIKKLD